MFTDEISILLTYGLVIAIALGLQVTGMITQLDMGYLLSSRDEKQTLDGMLGRGERAINNSLVAMGLFAPAVLAIVLRDKGSDHTMLAAEVFLAARLVYLPAYAFGITGLRTGVWTIGYIATVVLYFLAF